MEIDDPNLFSPECIYGDQVQNIMEFLSQNPKNIDGKIKEDFKDAVFKQIDRIRGLDKFHLPSFGEGFHWLNTSSPLSFDDLKNKVYVMDFFTYCCINCIHILPYLKEVETCYSHDPGFAVIGIHSPKFPNEKDLDRVREAVIRNNIHHPVLNDSDCKLWKTYGVNCWPTVFIVGPAHDLLFVLVGEAQIDKLSFLCDHVLNYYKSCEIQLDLQPLPVSPIKEELNEADMLFPGNVSTNGDLIAVSDTGHNRLLLMSRSFKLKEKIGSGCVGCQDGPFNLASFNAPHGTAWYKDVLYIADTGNHSIRKICFKSKSVTTVFSRQVDIINMDEFSTAKTEFKSPWDVCVGPELNCSSGKQNVLYIAVAGSHQIFELHLEGYEGSRDNVCVPFAGSGREENRQNLYRFKAGFSQPSGITYSLLSPHHLFVADSESSTIKSIALKDGAVKTIVGGGHNPSDLFQFGDKDGKYTDVKLQHPMGICVLKDGLLAIADTYNHKIKFVNTNSKECSTYGTDVNFCEPSGMCVIGDTLLIADTNNHRIVPIRMPDKILDLIPEQFDNVVEISPITNVAIGYGAKLFCHFHVTASSDYDFNKNGSQQWDVSFEGDFKLHIIYKNEIMCGDKQPSLILQPCSDVKDFTEVSEITVTGILPFCDKKLKVCCSKKITFKVIVNVLKEHPFKSVCLNFNAVVD